MATGKNWRSQHTVWQQVQKWTKSENSILVRYACVVTTHDTDTNDDMTTMTVFHTEHIKTNTWVCFVSFILCQRIVIHCTRTAWLKSELCPSRHPIHMRSWCVRFSLAFDLSFSLHLLYLTHLLSHSFHFFPYLKFVDNLRMTPKESMASIDETYSHTQAFCCFFFVAEFPLSGWDCQWKPSWIPVGESFQKAYLEEWKNMGDDSPGHGEFSALVQGHGNKGYISRQKLPEEAPLAPRSAEQPDALPWETHWAPGYCILLGKNWGSNASFTTQVQLHPPKAA